MCRAAKILKRCRETPGSIKFLDLIYLVEANGFVQRRTKGSHRHYRREGFSKTLTLLPEGKGTKPYLVKQVLAALEELENV